MENLHKADQPRSIPVDAAASPAVLRLRGILTGIQERWSELLYLRYFEELEYAAIGERLGMPINQVGVYLTRALATLRDEIKRSPGLWEELRELFP
jgi:RNA polymerase sigma factor (sigma-70 family)